MPRARNFSDAEKAQIVSLYIELGLTIADISRLLGCSGTPILRVLRDKDVPMRAQGDALKSTRNTKIMNMNDKGYTNDEIAQSLNISRQRVNQIIARGY